METGVQAMAPTLADSSSSLGMLQEVVATTGDKALTVVIGKQWHREVVEVTLVSIIREIWLDGTALIEHKGMVGRISDRQTLSSSEAKAAAQSAIILGVRLLSRDNSIKGFVPTLMPMGLFSVVSLEILKKGVEEDRLLPLMGTI